MNALADQIKGKWHQIKGKLKAKYGELTDDDLTYVEGKEEQLIGKLQERLGKSKQEIKELIDNL